MGPGIGTVVGCGGNQPQRERDIPAQMGQIEREIDNLNGACRTLIERMSVVTRIAPPTGGAEKMKKESESNCELSRWMRDQAVKIREIREVVEMQIELLEI